MDELENEHRQERYSDNHQKDSLNERSSIGQVQQEVVQGFMPWHHTSKRALVLIIAYLVVFVLFLVLACMVSVYPVWSIDVAITREFQEERLPWLKWFMVAVSFLGSQFGVFTGLILLTAVVFWLLRLHLEAIFILGLSVVSAVLNQLIKSIVSRPRPTSSLVEIFQSAYGQSFPSAHVMSYVAYWGLLFSFGFILLKRDCWWHYLFLIVPALFVLLVGPSRIYLGNHWASDVLGGYMFGGLLLGIALWLYLYLKGKGVLAPKDRRTFPDLDPAAQA